MKITFGMPEILIILSVIIYSSHSYLSIIIFLLGIISRFIAYVVSINSKSQSNFNQKVKADENKNIH